MEPAKGKGDQWPFFGGVAAAPAAKKAAPKKKTASKKKAAPKKKAASKKKVSLLASCVSYEII